ncbi:iron complex transport system substrate-binding protein [Hasllibacter halocynthiae]|uniref:Iron complex transport system substrate-binding protein n=1 Tax=Hasllibacter halocynthiae TaxID=595589 RepID=A0A2T0WZ95_9RHOB|nr:ABC transporter substrate-binding protein [Hasllibacter halocynthiae]PRY92023.1 iron complex transport system substrate-binding protein [Hasllibacter halocynthiae]
MSAFAAPSRIGALLALLALPAWGEGAPRRVVSMNACTDQLAMLVAGEDQLISVSHLAADPRVSAMAGEARHLALNHGRAEEIFLMDPDLVLAGSFSGRAAADMLAGLGIPVETFEPATDLGDVAAGLRRVGALLGREERAEALAAGFEARLEALRDETGRRPRAALYYANGYTLGDRTLAGQILLAAGFRNVAAEAGFPAGGVMPLEVLVMAAPEVVVTGQRYPGASRSEEILDHPAVRALREGRRGGIADQDWVCGTPFVLRAIEDLARTRRGGGP